MKWTDRFCQWRVVCWLRKKKLTITTHSGETVNQMTFKDFFKQATNGKIGDPFPFQEAFAKDIPALVRVPTGLGKTAMAVLGWLWRRNCAGEEIRHNTPRRLVYCLPMRVLVEQTRDEAQVWIRELDLKEDISIHILMGSEEADDWDLYPERDSILIGTQDMLISRALNRGYAMSRFRWPLAFGLLNNDCLWVLDEVQLMDASLATSTQLHAFREKMNAQGCKTVWMSATLETKWLKSVDFFTPTDGPLELGAEDTMNNVVKSRIDASKPIQRAEAPIDAKEACANAILEAHRESNDLTLAIFNTVERAKEVYLQLKKQTTKVVLLHSRFRPNERKEIIKCMMSESSAEGRIVVSTQVVEAGVDLDAMTLFTELAPWPSLVQRFGRCNRRGKYNEDESARIVWFDIDDKKEKDALPSSLEELTTARKLLAALEDAGPSSLQALREQKPDLYEQAMRLEPTHVLRRRDLIDLFDTTPDLAGADIDVSRFIRSGEEHDVHVFWRTWEQKGSPSSDDEYGKAPRREELCAAPVGKFREFAKKQKDFIWRWDALEKKWKQVDPGAVYPGQTYLIHAEAGGYDIDLGWIGYEKKPKPVNPIEIERPESEGNDDDLYAQADWLTIAEHTNDVVQELDKILGVVQLDESYRDVLRIAALWHDRGKAHEVFQEAIEDGRFIERMKGDPIQEKERPSVWQGRRDLAKAPKKPDNYWKKYSRSYFRHELASALAMLQAGMPDLAVYLAAAHHGKVRLSIRSMPNEKPPENAETLFARGVYDDDVLPEVNLGDREIAPSVELSLKCMRMGRDENGAPSWAERMLRLRDELGPFRLAYLEALLRAADMRASARKSTQQTAQEVTP